MGLPYLEMYCAGVTMETVTGFITQTRYNKFSSDLLQFSRDEDGNINGAYVKVGNWNTTSDAFGLMKSLLLTTFIGSLMEVELKFELKKKNKQATKGRSVYTPKALGNRNWLYKIGTGD